MSTSGGDSSPTRQGLAGLLRGLREATRPRISQTAAAKAIGASQNKISRAEAGAWVLGPDEVRVLGKLYGATAAEQRRLVAWATALAGAELDSRLMLRRGGGTAAFQARLRDIEQGSTEIRAFQPALVIGVLQTEAYARVVFGDDPTGVAKRMRRTRQLLEDSGRRWTLVQSIGALLWNLGGAEVMAEQVEALAGASRHDHVDLRIITPDRGLAFTAAHGFHLYDRQAVVVGILTGTTLSTDEGDVEQYAAQFDRLVHASIGGEEARTVLQRLAAAYRHGDLSIGQS
jgi:hypothetical protein